MMVERHGDTATRSGFSVASASQAFDSVEKNNEPKVKVVIGRRDRLNPARSGADAGRIGKAFAMDQYGKDRRCLHPPTGVGGGALPDLRNRVVSIARSDAGKAIEQPDDGVERDVIEPAGSEQNEIPLVRMAHRMRRTDLTPQV